MMPKNDDIMRVVVNHRALARRLGVTREYVGMLLDGRRVTPKYVKRIRKILQEERKRMGLPAEIPLQGVKP